MNLFEQGLKKYLSQGQLERIRSFKIGIGGAGGLGSNLAVILTRCGFNQFEILDHDAIEPSNLNRQYYFIEEIGQKKVETLKQRMLHINPEMRIGIHQARWTPEIGDQFFKDCYFVAEAFDQAQWKRDFVEFYQSKANFVISGNGMAGLLVPKRMDVRKIKNIFLVGDGTTEGGVANPPMSPRVTACAAMMAEVILDLSLATT